MKKVIALILAAIFTAALMPAAFADGIEIEEIYDSYGYGEEIFVCGTTVTEGVIVSLTDTEGANKYYYVALDANTLEKGIYIGVDKNWPLGEYILRVSYGAEYVNTYYIQIVEERVSHSAVSSSGNKTDVTATDVSVSDTELELKVGDTAELTAKGEKTSFKWTTDDDDKITVSAATSATAKITAKKTGTATLWVYCGNNYATVNITIVPADSKPSSDDKESGNNSGLNEDKENKQNDSNDNGDEDNGDKEEKETAENTEKSDKFPDLEEALWAKESVNSLAEAGIIDGMGDGTFAPQANVTRAQFVKMTVRAFDLENKGEAAFDDVSPDAWYADDVLTAASNGIINGVGDGKFAPEANISCRDAALIIQRVLAMNNTSLPAPAEAPEGSEYAAEAVGELISAGIITDEMKFSPSEKATRAQSAYLIYGAYKLKAEVDGGNGEK